MLSLHTNAASLSTQNSLASTNKALSSSMTKLGTGFRVNSAMDDAAGLQIATRLNAQARGMSVAQKNTQNGISMLQTAEGAMNEVGNMLLRMKDLATESSNGTSSDKDKLALEAEYNALATEIRNIFGNTSFGGENLFAADTASAMTAAGALGKAAGISFQVGATEAEVMKVTFNGAAAANGQALKNVMTELGKISKQLGTTAAAGTELSTATDSSLITKINTAIEAVGTFRSEMGAASNRLEHTYNNLGNMIQNTEAAKGRIMDVDYATETSNMTSKQMLMQASTAMLKQSSSMSQMVASLLQ